MKHLLTGIVATIILVSTSSAQTTSPAPEPQAPPSQNTKEERDKRDLAECAAANRKDGRLDGAGFAKCLTERARVSREAEQSAARARLEAMREKAAKDKAAAAEKERALTDDHKRRVQAGVTADAERREKEEAARAARVDQNQRREAEYQANRAQLLREMDAAKAEEQRAEDARRKKCGGDYGKIAVGMNFSRVQQCSGPFMAIGQINRGDGVVSTFENPWWFVHVMRGTVIAWTAR